MTLIRITWKLLVLLTALIFVGTLHAADKTGQDEWRFASYGKAAKGSVTMDSNTLTIKTENTKNAFFESDEYSFVYKEQPFLHDDCSKSVITVKIDDIKKGSAGIMMRSTDSQSSANVHLEATATGDLFVFFRQQEGGSTSYRRVGYIGFPVEIRLTRQGNSFLSHYKNAADEWIKGPAVFVDLGETHLSGFYACSGNDNQIGYDVDSSRKMQVTFRDWTIENSDNFIPAEDNFVDKEPIAPNTGPIRR